MLATKTEIVPVWPSAQSLLAPDVETTEGWQASEAGPYTTQVRGGDCSEQVVRSGWSSYYFEGRICSLFRRIGSGSERERLEGLD